MVVVGKCLCNVYASAGQGEKGEAEGRPNTRVVNDLSHPNKLKASQP
jgi:hypothetical protein